MRGEWSNFELKIYQLHHRFVFFERAKATVTDFPRCHFIDLREWSKERRRRRTSLKKDFKDGDSFFVAAATETSLSTPRSCDVFEIDFKLHLNPSVYARFVLLLLLLLRSFLFFSHHRSHFEEELSALLWRCNKIFRNLFYALGSQSYCFDGAPRNALATTRIHFTISRHKYRPRILLHNFLRHSTFSLGGIKFAFIFVFRKASKSCFAVIGHMFTVQRGISNIQSSRKH